MSTELLLVAALTLTLSGILLSGALLVLCRRRCHKHLEGKQQEAQIILWLGGKNTEKKVKDQQQRQQQGVTERLCEQGLVKEEQQTGQETNLNQIPAAAASPKSAALWQRGAAGGSSSR